MKASILTIGDEILNGTTIDTNSAYIANNCENIGLSIHQIISVSDTYEGIHHGLTLAASGVSIIFITGGLGPTKDDITKQALADFFGMSLKFDEHVFESVRQYFQHRGQSIVERNKKLAYIPEGCELVQNHRGTAWGMWFEQNEQVFVSMPGVPHEMKHMLKHEVFPRIQKKKLFPLIINRYIMTVGIGESSINEKIEDVEDALPEWIKLAFLPSLGSVKLRLTARNPKDPNALTIMEEWQHKISERLKKYTYSFEESAKLEAVIGEMLRARNETISTAESCTGGYISHLLTSVPGSSAYYEGSVISYSYSIKEEQLGVKKTTLEQFGAVSEETVVEMLEGLLLKMKTTYGIAVSGIAGPGGGLPDKPVGTVWIAVGDKQQTITRKFQLTKVRKINIELTSVIALNMLRRFILGDIRTMKEFTTN